MEDILGQFRDVFSALGTDNFRPLLTNSIDHGFTTKKSTDKTQK